MMQTDLLYKFRKSILFFIELISFLTVTAVFMFSWSEWYVSASFQMKGNFVVIIIYALMLTVFLSVFGGFKYGSARLHDLTFSTCLALLFTDFFTYFELCLIARDLLRPWGMLICAVIQIALAFLCCYCTNSIYYMVNHIKNILAVTGGSEPSKALIRKMKSIELRYSIQRGILADKGIEAIKSAIGDHDAVLICDDIEASLKSELIRYCYSIGKKIYVQLPILFSATAQKYRHMIRLCSFAEREVSPMSKKRSRGFLISSYRLSVSSWQVRLWQPSPSR